MKIRVPRSSRLKRVKRFFDQMPPPPWHPGARRLREHAKAVAEMDVGIRAQVASMKERAGPFQLTRLRGGSGFRMAETLRDFFHEFNQRISKTGAYSLPISFNVVEGFLEFSDEYRLFDLRREREHLIQLRDYLDWYTSGQMPEAPGILIDAMEEGLVYSYDMADPASDFTIATPDSELVIAGISMVRHGDEVSAIAVVGEKPPHPSDEAVAAGFKNPRPLRGHEEVTPADYGIGDRYLEGLPGHCRVIALVRFDVRARTYDVRYLSIDFGQSFVVYTDETDILPGAADRVDELERARLILRMEEGLNRYRDLFAALASAIYLPVFFMVERKRVEDTEFVTALGAEKEADEVRNAVRKLGKDAVPMVRVLHCLRSSATSTDKTKHELQPPALGYEASGYWKALPPGEVGEDKDGKKIVGRTWVHRHETWAAQAPSSFVMQREERKPEGPDPGAIYVARSPAHEQGIYKVGLTRRSTVERAEALSGATGVPLPFGVLASWIVGDCGKLESAAHEALAAHRLNPRREFFRAELSDIVATVQKLVDQADVGTTKQDPGSP